MIPKTMASTTEAAGAEAGRIVLFVQNPLSRRDWKRFGIPVFLTHGIAVTVLDVADVVLPDLKHDRGHYGEFEGFDLRVIRSPVDLVAARPLVAGADIAINLAQSGYCSPENISIFRLIARARVPYLVIASNTYPGWDRARTQATGLVGRLGDALSRWKERKLGHSLMARIPPHWLGVPPPDFVVHGGRNHFESRLVGSGTRVIRVHAMDYDLCLEEKARNAPPTETAVFIDEYRPYHRDLRAMGYKRIVDADVYYAQLRRLFDRIERELGLEVVIAACPRADYSDMPGIFGDRRTVQDVTSRIIANCRLVLAHRSTAIGFAVAFGKPVLLIATRENYEHPSQKPYFDGFERVLGKPIQSYEDPAAVDLSIAFNIDRDRYDAYMENYIKCKDTPELPYWEIVLGELKAAGVFANRDAGAEGTAGR